MKVVVTSSKRTRPPKRIVMLLTASIALNYTVEFAEHEIGEIGVRFASASEEAVCNLPGGLLVLYRKSARVNNADIESSLGPIGRNEVAIEVMPKHGG